MDDQLMYHTNLQTHSSLLMKETPTQSYSNNITKSLLQIIMK